MAHFSMMIVRTTGFYDPCPFVDKQLYIQYLFLGEEHEVSSTHSYIG